MKIFYDVDTQNDFMNKDGNLYVPRAENIKPNLEKITKFAIENNLPVLGSVDRHFGTEEYKHREEELNKYGGPFPDHCMDKTFGQLKIRETTLIQLYGRDADWLSTNGQDLGFYIQHMLYHNYPAEPIPKAILEVRLDMSKSDLFREWSEIRSGIDDYLIKEAVKQIHSKGKQSGIYFEKQNYDVFTNPHTEIVLKRANVKEAVVYGVATDFCVKAAVLGMQKLGIQTYLVKDAISGVFPESTNKALEEMKNTGSKFITTEDILKNKV